MPVHSASYFRICFLLKIVPQQMIHNFSACCIQVYRTKGSLRFQVSCHQEVLSKSHIFRWLQHFLFLGNWKTGKISNCLLFNFQESSPLLRTRTLLLFSLPKQNTRFYKVLQFQGCTAQTPAKPGSSEPGCFIPPVF